MHIEPVDKAIPKHTFDTMDGLRGVAAIMVAWLHMKIFFPLYPVSGHLAVDLFFMLSGFVIYHSYRQRLEYSISKIHFIKIRLIRFYPLYILGICISFFYLSLAAITNFSHEWPLLVLCRSFIFSSVFLPDFFAIDQGFSTVSLLNPPVWSLICELYVNVLFCLVALKMTTQILQRVTFSLAIIMTFYCIIVGPFAEVSAINYTLGGLLRCLYGFFCGMLIYKYAQFKIHIGNTAPLLLCLVVFIMLMLNIPQSYRIIYDLVSIFVGFPLIILIASKFNPGKILTRVFSFLGFISYAIYAVHFPIEKLATSVLKRFNNGIFINPYIGLIMLVCMILGSYLLCKYFDVPIRALLSAKLLKKRS